ncbi:MAG: phosphodiesterase [Clostridia bacterium]|nr:phosphodiesterase [Clostridia bacterium]
MEKSKNLQFAITFAALLLFLLFFAYFFETDTMVTVSIAAASFFLLTYAWIRSYAKLGKKAEENFQQQKIINERLEQCLQDQTRELHFFTNHDTLTTLFNRRYFISQVEGSIKAKTENDLIAVVIMDVDRFKTINDTLGHDVGDAVLNELSSRLIQWNKCSATLARLGGDEFAILFFGPYKQTEVQTYCSQMIQLCSQPVILDEKEIAVSISAGVSVFNKVTDNVHSLVKNADIAMYQAKAQGYNKCQFYNTSLGENVSRNNTIEVLLKRESAEIEKEFNLYYQPQFSLPEKQLVGAEALIRWRSAECGYIPPNVFIPIAEEIDHILNIGRWVMQETVKQSIKWNTNLNRPIKIGFNVSTKQLKDEIFFETIKGLLSNNEFNTAWIDAEITESIMVSNEQKIHAIFSLLKSVGITVSIDDFGSGYSALAYLNKFPIDRIKIDKSLVDNLLEKNKAAINVVKAVIAMAKASGAKTIAEGVESQEQLAILTELGCDQVQGFLLGRPVPAHVFEKKFLYRT